MSRASGTSGMSRASETSRQQGHQDMRDIRDTRSVQVGQIYPSFLRQFLTSAKTRFPLLSPLFQPCWGFSDTLSPAQFSPGAPVPARSSQGFYLQPQTSAAFGGTSFGEQPHPKTIPAEQSTRRAGDEVLHPEDEQGNYRRHLCQCH